MKSLLGRPLQFGDAEQIAALKQLEKVECEKRKYIVNVKYVEVIELEKTSVYEIYATTPEKAESEAEDKIIKRYEKQKSIEIDFIDCKVTEVKKEIEKDEKTLNLFKKIV